MFLENTLLYLASSVSTQVNTPPDCIVNCTAAGGRRNTKRSQIGKWLSLSYTVMVRMPNIVDSGARITSLRCYVGYLRKCTESYTEQNLLRGQRI